MCAKFFQFFLNPIVADEARGAFEMSDEGIKRAVLMMR